jgi:hypothetical protein
MGLEDAGVLTQLLVEAGPLDTGKLMKVLEAYSSERTARLAPVIKQVRFGSGVNAYYDIQIIAGNGNCGPHTSFLCGLSVFQNSTVSGEPRFHG